MFHDARAAVSFGRTLLDDGGTDEPGAIVGAVAFVLVFVCALVWCTRTIRGCEELRLAEQVDPLGPYLPSDLADRVFHEIYLGQLQLSQRWDEEEAQYQRRQQQLVAQSPNLHLTPKPQVEEQQQQQHPNQTPSLRQNQQNQQDQKDEQDQQEEGGPEIPQDCWLNVEDMVIEKQGS